MSGSRRRPMWTLVMLVVAAVVIPAGAQQNADGWMQLYNGRSLDGWKHVGPGSFTVENGLLTTHGGMGLLYWTGGKVSNCEIRVVYRMKHEDDNSGVFVRIPIEPREPWMPVNYGYEVQIDNNENDYHVTGALYSLTKAMARPGKPGPQWNTMLIRLEARRTQVWVNGVMVTDYIEGSPVPAKKFEYEPDRGPRPEAGWIGLQNHSDKDVVEFKEVALRRIR